MTTIVDNRTPMQPAVLYCMEPGHLLMLKKIAKRLYTEMRMDGNDMRDAAHAIMAIVGFAESMGLDEYQLDGLAAKPAPKLYTVKLCEAGPDKIRTIKVVREVMGIGLKESKDMIEAALPQIVCQTSDEERSKTVASAFQQAGAIVQVVTE